MKKGFGVVVCCWCGESLQQEEVYFQLTERTRVRYFDVEEGRQRFKRSRKFRVVASYCEFCKNYFFDPNKTPIIKASK